MQNNKWTNNFNKNDTNSYSLLTNKKPVHNGNLLKRKKPFKWSDSDTQLFYRTIEVFGEDLKSIQKVFYKKTERQLLRKMQKEKKRNPQIYSNCLQINKLGISKDYNFIEDLMKKTSEDEDFEASSIDSLDLIINEKLAMIYKTETPDIKPWDFYLNNF